MRKYTTKQVLSWLGYTGIFAGLSAASTATTALWLMGAKPSLELALVVILATISSYAIDRVSDRRRDEHLQRARTLARVHLIRTLGFGLFGLAMALTIAKRPSLVFALVGMPLAVAFYVFPWLGYLCPPLLRRGVRRIKDIPLIKAFYVTGCWVVVPPFAALFVGHPFDFRLLLAVMIQAPFLFINVVACDIRDIEADKKAGVITIPIFVGVSRTLFFLRIINLIWALALVGAVGANWVPRVVWALPLQSLLVEVCLARIQRNEADLEFYGDVVFDAIIVIHPILILVGAFISKQLE